MKNFSLAAFAVLGLVTVLSPRQAEAQPTKRERTIERGTRSSAAATKRTIRIDRMFRLADRDKDSFLSLSEYRHWYRTMAPRRTAWGWRRRAHQLFSRLDASRDNRLSRAEFAADPTFRRTRPGWWSIAPNS